MITLDYRYKFSEKYAGNLQPRGTIDLGGSSIFKHNGTIIFMFHQMNMAEEE